jgi:hypothetical protein
MELKNVLPWGRSFEEYQKMFSLTDADLSKRILGCGDGPASFNAQLTARGGKIISIDPVYQFDAASLQTRIREAYNEIMPQARKNQEKYIWDSIPSVEALGKIRMDAMNIFIADFERGKEEGRYLCEALPRLGFEDDSFDLALCSHYLFLYSDHIGTDEHIASVKELCRVAREARIYPLLTLKGDLSPHLNAVMAALNTSGLTTSLVAVGYQFQKGATQMLVIKR